MNKLLSTLLLALTSVPAFAHGYSNDGNIASIGGAAVVFIISIGFMWFQYENAKATKAAVAPVVQKTYASKRGVWVFRVIAQSGGVQREETFQGTYEDALKKVQTTFNRAKIYDNYGMKQENDGTIRFSRGTYNGRGRHEAKRVGGATIKMIQEL